jgi:hypothetical protein
MATLILTTVGTAIGGPVGAAMGAILGQQIDGALFAPKKRHGPRLGDLAVQTSSYGTQIPKIFGRMRVAGTVIWSTDIKESRSNSGGGKGQQRSVNYSYSASFAVALSARPISGVRRIWADGKLLRGEAGDFKSRTGFRFHPGSESQSVDPLIASVEGIGMAPAHRGIAYAVFEDFQLGDYGNRIPSLTFEIEADAQPVTVGQIAEELSGRAVTAGATAALGGYAASGDSVRTAIEALGDVLPLSLADQGETLLLAAAPGAPVLIKAADQNARGPKGSGGRSELSRTGAGSIAGAVSIAYYDAARDYLAGLQRATGGAPSLRSEYKSLPAALSAGAAKSLAEHRLSCLWSARQYGKIHLPWSCGGIRAGAHLKVEGLAGLWRVARCTLDRMVVSLDISRVPPRLAAEAAAATPGTPVKEPDLLHGATSVVLFDVPLIADGVAERPILVAAAAGASAGWRGASMETSYDRGATWQPELGTRGRAIIGKAVTKLAPSGSTLLDMKNSVEVELLNASMWLEARSDAALAGGANLAVLGGELVQFGRAEPLGDGRFRLSRLLRGRRGTEAASEAHLPGEPFLLLDPASIIVIEPPAGAAGGEIWLSAEGLGDGGAPVVAKASIEARALKPPSPVHLRTKRLPNGDVFLTWVRRSRNGWNWLDGIDAPLVEEREAYSVRLSGIGFERVSGGVAEASLLYTAAHQAKDGFTGAARVEVKQIGTHGSSDPARTNINHS